MEKTFLIQNKLGLHARAASYFVQEANRFDAEIFIIKDGQEVNGKSILGVLMLAAPKGAEITLRIEGDDAEAAMEALGKLINDKYDSGQDIFLFHLFLVVFVDVSYSRVRKPVEAPAHFRHYPSERLKRFF